MAGLTEALDIAARSAQRDHGVRIAYIFDVARELGASAGTLARRGFQIRPRDRR